MQREFLPLSSKGYTICTKHALAIGLLEKLRLEVPSIEYIIEVLKAARVDGQKMEDALYDYKARIAELESKLKGDKE